MKCPYCGHKSDKVVDSRESKDGEAIRRRRECLKCTKRYTTYEQIEHSLPMVVKKDNRREPFDRKKILNGLIKACEKRPVSVEQLEEVVDDIEKQLYSKMEKEVPSTVIGNIIMEKLALMDEVAYVRFASVYRQFKDINAFTKELKKFLTEKNDK
ncbi:MAG TPA: transcriptional regulator NrdR [Candidatus Goldiibacteriota bacterium]|nr:transcriptional regulator NrdR [Candidatus Goldiibacteriota bacterium]HRQ43267.1 transcriptional regulator NrdR [Candidatus Goldiibacteriota bacterium]